MNTQDGKPTIIVPDNQPVHMRRTPQLGDTIILHGGPRPAGPDAPSLDAGIAKGDSAGEPAAEDEALGGILGGHPPATTDSEKIFAASTPAADGAIGDAPTASTEPMVVPQYTEDQLRWSNGIQTGWLIRDEAKDEDLCFASYVGASDYFQEHERTRWLIPGTDEMEDWKPAPGADVPRDTSAADSGTAA